jgi:hypothetical protein
LAVKSEEPTERPARKKLGATGVPSFIVVIQGRTCRLQPFWPGKPCRKASLMGVCHNAS